MEERVGRRISHPLFDRGPAGRRSVPTACQREPTLRALSAFGPHPAAPAGYHAPSYAAEFAMQGVSVAPVDSSCTVDTSAKGGDSDAAPERGRVGSGPQAGGRDRPAAAWAVPVRRGGRRDRRSRPRRPRRVGASDRRRRVLSPVRAAAHLDGTAAGSRTGAVTKEEGFDV